MSAMRWTVLLVVVFGCSKDASAPVSPLVGQSRTLVDKLCACPAGDAACVATVDEKWNELASDRAAQTLSAEDVDALAAEAQRYAKCLADRK
jgi:hypothetical protein